jgi:hypothetical protein
MVHRDIKPDNLLLCADEQSTYTLKIADFGLAWLAAGNGLTATGSAVCTPAYMSPEQFQGAKVDGRSDIYSLGIVLYELCAGRRPFEIGALVEASYKHVFEQPPPPRQWQPDLPAALEEIILRCLAKRPEERFAAAELVVALDQVLDGRGQWLERRRVSPALLPRLWVVDAQGAVVQTLDLREEILVGSADTNQVVLDAEGVSRHHLRVVWENGQVIVTDLGSSEGTLLGDARLSPQVPQAWNWNQPLRLGPFCLQVEQPSRASVADNKPLSPPPRPDQIDIQVEPETLMLVAGQPAGVRLTLQSHQVDQLALSIEGVPEDWLMAAIPVVKLSPGREVSVNLDINVPRSPENSAGQHPILIHARSRLYQGVVTTASACWIVQPFANSAITLSPSRARGRTQAFYRVTLRNDGNAAAIFRLSGADEDQVLSYIFTPERVTLDAGRSTTVRLAVERQMRLVGGTRADRFQVSAHSAGGGDVQTARAHFVQTPLLPVWMIVAVLLLAALAGGWLLLSNRTGSLPRAVYQAVPATFEQLCRFDSINWPANRL